MNLDSWGSFSNSKPLNFLFGKIQLISQGVRNATWLSPTQTRAAVNGRDRRYSRLFQFHVMEVQSCASPTRTLKGRPDQLPPHDSHWWQTHCMAFRQENLAGLAGLKNYFYFVGHLKLQRKRLCASKIFSGFD